MAIDSVTFIVPALNENEALANTLDEIMRIMKDEGAADFEILAVNDGSTDDTGAIANSYAKRYPNIRALHNPSPRGIGQAYKRGIPLATKNQYMLVHGDNEILADSIRKILKAAGSADFVITYLQNDTRPSGRLFFSRYFTRLVNFLFSLKVRYYNGPNLIPLKLLKEITILTNGHAFMAEVIVRLAKRGYAYAEVEFESRLRVRGRSKAFRIKNIISVLRAILRLRFTLADGSASAPNPEKKV